MLEVAYAYPIATWSIYNQQIVSVNYAKFKFPGHLRPKVSQKVNYF